MTMSIFLENISSNLVNKALDFSIIEHKVHANNIANANTLGFHAQSVSFKDTLAQISKAIDDKQSPKYITELLESIDIQNISLIQLGTQVNLDQEMVSMSKINMHYQALLSAKSSFGSITKMAIKGGRI